MRREKRQSFAAKMPFKMDFENDRIYKVAGIGIRFPRVGRISSEQSKEVGRVQGVS